MSLFDDDIKNCSLNCDDFLEFGKMWAGNKWKISKLIGHNHSSPPTYQRKFIHKTESYSKSSIIKIQLIQHKLPTSNVWPRYPKLT